MSPALRRRPLGRTGLEVSEIGFGTWGLGGTSYGPADDAVSIRALHRAFDRGITFYDTSDLYGDGHAEEVLGRAFATGRRSEIVIGTKVGMLPHTDFAMPQDFSLAHVERALAASLERLGTDYVDLYLLHSPPLDLPNWDDLIAWLDRARVRGQVRSFGVSARSPKDALALIERYPLGAIQVNYNLIDHRASDGGLFSACAARGVGIVARTPLCFGFLTGHLTGEETFVPPDHRANWPREQLRRWAKAPAVFSPIAEAEGRTLTQLALQWCLADEAVSTAIPGMMTEAEVDENTSVAAYPPLGDAGLEAIRAAYRTEVFYDPGARQQPGGTIAGGTA